MQQRAYAAGTVWTLLVHSPGGNTFLRKVTLWPPSLKYDVISEIRLRRSMRIYLENNPTKFHPDPIWNDEALGFFWRASSQKRTTATTTTRWAAIWDQFLIQKIGHCTCYFEPKHLFNQNDVAVIVIRLSEVAKFCLKERLTQWVISDWLSETRRDVIMLLNVKRRLLFD